jgi:hypothetical protein
MGDVQIGMFKIGFRMLCTGYIQVYVYNLQPTFILTGYSENVNLLGKSINIIKNMLYYSVPQSVVRRRISRGM